MHRRIDLVSLTGTAAALLLTASIARAEIVQVEATRRDDRAQVLLTWPAPVGITTQTRKGRFHIRFDRPVEGDFLVIRQLRRFTRLPTISNDGLRLTFPLQPDIAAVASASGEKVLIDFSPAPPRVGAPAATPAEVTTEPAAGRPRADPKGQRADRSAFGVQPHHLRLGRAGRLLHSSRRRVNDHHL